MAKEKVFVTHYFQDDPMYTKGALTFTNDGRIYRGIGTNIIEYGGRVKGVSQNGNTAQEPDTNGVINIGNVVKSLTINNGAVYTPDANGRIDAWTDAHQRVLAKEKVCQNSFNYAPAERTSLFRYNVECELAGTDVYLGNIDDIPSSAQVSANNVGHFVATKNTETSEPMYVNIFGAYATQGKMLIKIKVTDFKTNKYETHYAQIAFGTAAWATNNISNEGCFGVQSSLNWNWRTFFGADAKSSDYTSKPTNLPTETGYPAINNNQKHYNLTLFLEIPADFRGIIEWTPERKITDQGSDVFYTNTFTYKRKDNNLMYVVPFMQMNMGSNSIPVEMFTNAVITQFNTHEFTDTYNKWGAKFGYYYVDTLASLGEEFGNKNFDDPTNPVYIADTIVNDYLLHWVIKKLNQIDTDLYWSNT